MAEEASRERPRAQRTKITLSDIGVPAAIKSMPPDQLAKAGNKLVLGRLIGIASGFLVRTSADKTETFEGLKGQFRVIPSDPQLEELESGVLFIPDAFHNMIADTLRAVQKDDANASARFAFEVSCVAAKNPAGYSWQFQPLIAADKANPLDALTAEIMKLPPPKAQAQVAHKR